MVIKPAHAQEYLQTEEKDKEKLLIEAIEAVNEILSKNTYTEKETKPEQNDGFRLVEKAGQGAFKGEGNSVRFREFNSRELWDINGNKFLEVSTESEYFVPLSSFASDSVRVIRGVKSSSGPKTKIETWSLGNKSVVLRQMVQKVSSSDGTANRNDVSSNKEAAFLLTLPSEPWADTVGEGIKKIILIGSGR